MVVETTARGAEVGAFDRLAELVLLLAGAVVRRLDCVVAPLVVADAAAPVELLAAAALTDVAAGAAAVAAAGAVAGVAAGVTAGVAVGALPVGVPPVGAGADAGVAGVPKPDGVQAHAIPAPTTPMPSTESAARMKIRARLCTDPSYL